MYDTTTADDSQHNQNNSERPEEDLRTVAGDGNDVTVFDFDRGDRIRVEYDSVHSDEPQEIEGTVTRPARKGRRYCLTFDSDDEFDDGTPKVYHVYNDEVTLETRAGNERRLSVARSYPATVSLHYPDPEYEPPYEPGSDTYERLNGRNKYGIMYAGDYRWDNVECTRRAYGDSPQNDLQGRSLKYHSQWMDVEEAVECVQQIGGYNGFDPEYVAKALRDMPDDARIVVGRESSPVIYVWSDDAEAVMETFKRSGSDAARKKAVISDELRAIQDRRDDDEYLILKSPEEETGRAADLLRKYKSLPSCPATGPDELSDYDAPGYSTPFVDSHYVDTEKTLVRAWWD